MILIAPTAFKGTIGARAAAAAMARGADGFGHELAITPLSDGGPGLIEALERTQDRLTVHEVTGPLGSPTRARILLRDDCTIIESADACGLHLVPPRQRDPMKTGTSGVGELIRIADGFASREIIVGLGGSATIDGGIGCAGALGARFFDSHGAELPAATQSLSLVSTMKIGAKTQARLTILADVVTPLIGANGAARVFGPQKGADTATIEWLDAALASWARSIERELKLRVADLPGGGAAGGLGAALHAFAAGQLESGSMWVFNALAIGQLLQRATVVVTGEGSYDHQSALGKITGTLIEHARIAGIPVVLIAGRIEGALPEGLTARDGRGNPLSTDDLTRLTREGLATLLPP